MMYLILAVLASTCIAFFMRLGERYIKNNMVMFIANYAVCLLLARIFMGSQKLFTSQAGMGYAAIIGVISGILYLMGFVLLQYNIGKNGVVLSSLFMKLGVLVPTLMAVVVYHETPSVLQVLGFVLAIGAIVIINGKKDRDGKGTDTEGKSLVRGEKAAKWWLLALLFVGGVTDSLANVYDKQGVGALKNHYLFITFTAALVLSVVLKQIKKQSITRMDLLWGIIIGVPNYFSARFLLLSLGQLPAIIVYPAYNVATILAISVVGVVVFHEKLEKRKLLGLLLILIALVLLNV